MGVDRQSSAEQPAGPKSSGRRELLPQRPAAKLERAVVLRQT